jgi:WXG100 family type VII secretion target
MTIAVEHAAFDVGVRDVREAATELQRVRDRAAGRVNAFLQGGWSGLAADSFANAWSDWRRAADDVLTHLATIGDLLDAAHRDLSSRDRDTHAALEPLAARLDARLG